MKGARFLTIVLTTAIVITGSFVPVKQARAEDDLKKLTVYDGENNKEYSVISQNGDIYFSAEAYEELTDYTFAEGDQKLGYTLGDKIILIDPTDGSMSIPVLHYEGSVGEIIEKDGNQYISASQLLPWLNVSCGVGESGLEIVSDGISIWDITDDLDYESYMFNLYREYGDSISDIAGLSAMMTFDTLINLRWDRLVPADGVTGAFRNASLYDQKCYNSALSEVAQQTPFTGADAEKTINTIIKVNKGIGDLEEDLGIDEEAVQKDLDDYLIELGTDQEVVESFYNMLETWQTLRECVSSYSKIKKYMDIFAVLKAYELSVTADTEYRDYISWLSEQGTDNKLLNNALKHTEIILDEEYAAIFTAYANFGKEVMKDLPKEVVKAIAANSLDDNVIKACNSFNNSVFSSLGEYMLIAKVVYGVVIPVEKGYEGMAKVGVNENIQDFCWNLASQLKDEEMTEENIEHIRQSYLVALQTSKMSYKAMGDTQDVKLLGFIDILNAEGLMDYKLNAIEEKIDCLTASVDATENDSVEGKEEYTDLLLETFQKIEFTDALTEDQALKAIKNYCFVQNPDLEGIMDSGEYSLYWDVTTNDKQEIVVLYRSYTASQIRYYIDPVSGETYVTELVPGIIDDEQMTDERFNVRDYLDIVNNKDISGVFEESGIQQETNSENEGSNHQLTAEDFEGHYSGIDYGYSLEITAMDNEHASIIVSPEWIPATENWNDLYLEDNKLVYEEDRKGETLYMYFILNDSEITIPEDCDISFWEAKSGTEFDHHFYRQ